MRFGHYVALLALFFTGCLVLYFVIDEHETQKTEKALKELRQMQNDMALQGIHDHLQGCLAAAKKTGYKPSWC